MGFLRRSHSQNAETRFDPFFSIQISVPGFRKSNPDFWKLLMEDDKLPNPRYKYEIFLIDDVKAHESTKDVLTRDQNSELSE